MFYIKNRHGRIVCFDTPEQQAEWLAKPGVTKPTQADIDAWQQRREDEYKARLNAQYEVKRKDTGDIFFATVSGGNDGYGTSSQNIYRELKNIDCDISFSNRGQKIGFLYHAPYSIMRIDAPVRVLYTMFESTKIPDDWPDYLNSADYVIVPSKWCQKVFKEANIETQVIPLGYDDRFFTYVPRMDSKKNNRDFVFLHYNAYNLRKGFLEVVNAFNAEFGPDEPVKMIFKTNLARPPFPFVKSKYPNIEVITGEYSTDRLANLAQTSDCFVFPSRGEGFGMTPLECMATGMPVIVPNAHGITEYFNPDCMYEVEIEKTCPGIYTRYKGQDVGNMFVSSVKHLRQQMRYVYEHQDEAFAKGEKAAEYAKNYTYKKTAARLKALFDDIMSKPLPERKKTNILSLELV